MFRAQVICDSISKAGHRLTSIEAEFPTRILAEMNTHAILSKNASSTRAMPAAKLIEQVEKDPYVPVFWGKNQSGMQAREELEGESLRVAKNAYRAAIQKALSVAEALNHIGLHKQDVNALLMPFSWTKQLLTGTQWANFFALRTHQDAHPAMQRVARMMYLAYRASKPVELDYDQWHLPYITAMDREQLPVNERNPHTLQLISAARCARVSYWQHDGRQLYSKDIELAEKLLDAEPKHMSPFGHQARPALEVELAARPWWRSNLSGWLQYRKMIPGECVREFNPSEEEIASWGL